MKVAFSQVYIEPDANFPFSVHFQRLMTEEVTAITTPSSKFTESFGIVSELIFRISAKHQLEDNEIKGPTVFKNAKDVEFTIFLPFDVIRGRADASKQALHFLLKGVCSVFDMLAIDKTKLVDKQQALIERICSDPTMFVSRLM